MKSSRKRQGGFTLIEIAIVIVLLGVIALVALPQFVDMRTEARDETTKATLGNYRSAIAIANGAIAVKEDYTKAPAVYPTYTEVSGNNYLAAAPANHPKLAGTSIMNKSAGLPVNPWTSTTTVSNCTGKAKGTLLIAPDPVDDGWCYSETSGELWANSDLSKGPAKENTF